MRPSFCPAHGISLSKRPTYLFKDQERNFFVSLDLFRKVKKQKWESWRLGNENSEDAVTWNIFVGLFVLQGIKHLFRLFTGLDFREEPELYLWGCRIDDAQCKIWEKLKEVREVLERGVPTPTEPDIILRVPGKAIVLVEAKFGSPNGLLFKKGKPSVPRREFLQRYYARNRASDPLNRDWILTQQPSQILAQLCRNAVFSRWLGNSEEQSFVVNLVRKEAEVDVEQLFSQHLVPGRVGFRRVTWEEIYHLPILKTPDASVLKEYFENKTANLVKAFRL
jgi:hypothetical protein